MQMPRAFTFLGESRKKTKDNKTGRTVARIAMTLYLLRRMKALKVDVVFLEFYFF